MSPANTSSGRRPSEGASTRLLTSAEAAEYLRIPLNTLYQLRAKEKAPQAVRIGRHVHYRLADLEAYVEQCVDQP